MRIREAGCTDAEAIARVHLESWRTTYPGIIPQAYIDGLRVEDGILRWQERLDGHGPLTLVAEDATGIFGFASGGATVHPVNGFDGELGAIYLLASHQGRGAGRALVQGIAERLHEQGFRSMVVWALRENAACSFYERLGGVRVAEKLIEISGIALPEVAFGWPDIRSLLRPV